MTKKMRGHSGKRKMSCRLSSRNCGFIWKLARGLNVPKIQTLKWYLFCHIHCARLCTRVHAIVTASCVFSNRESVPSLLVPSHTYRLPAFTPHSTSSHFPSPSYRPPTILSLLDSLHSLLLQIRASGSCPLLLDMGLHVCLSVCSSSPFLDPWGASTWNHPANIVICFTH